MAVFIFVLGLAVVGYVLVGYPLVLLLLTGLRRQPKKTPAASVLPRVTAILPVRDGQRWLAQKLETLAALDYPPSLLQVVVVDDGSHDATAKIAGAWPGVEVVSIPASGKAVALNAGMARAKGDILFFTDVRQRLSPDALRHLVARFSNASVGVVSGELVIVEGTTRQEANVGLYWRYEKWVRRRQGLLGVLPGATGCIYAMRRELAVPLPQGTLVDDMYLPLVASFKGYDVVFEPRARAFDQPTTLKTEFRRKVRTLAGNYQLIGFRPRLLLPGHRVWLHFLSHKVGRLLLPFSMVLIGVSSAFLPEPWMPAMVAPQLALYGLAALDPWVPESAIIKGVSSPARTFVVLVGAAACAVGYLLPGTRQYWKPTGVDETTTAVGETNPTR
jgi:biofilm PGA synthesis N-glycosyltransferase PgaC